MPGISNELRRNRVIIIAEDIDNRIMHALQYARTISNDITVFSAVTNEEDEQRLRSRWAGLDMGIPLVPHLTPDGRVVDPLLEFIRSYEYGCKPDDVVTVILPWLVASSWLQRVLVNSANKYIVRQLLKNGSIVVVQYPYRLAASNLALEQDASGLQ